MFSRLKASMAASSMEDSGMMATSSLEAPVTWAACGTKPGSAAHSSRLFSMKRWMSSLASRSRAMCSMSARDRGASLAQVTWNWAEVYTAMERRSAFSTRARVSRAVRPSLSVTPGRKPTSSTQSAGAEPCGAGSRSSAASCSTGSCSTPLATMLVSASSERPSTVNTLTRRTDSTFRPSEARILAATLRPTVSVTCGRSPTSMRRSMTDS